MTTIPNIKLRAVVSLPAEVRGGTAIDVTQSGGVYTFDLDVSEVAQVGSVATTPAATTFLLLYDSATGSYSRISLTALKTTLAALP